MHLIADAGGTKTAWRSVFDDGEIQQFETRGFNIQHNDINSFLKEIKDELPSTENPISEIHFYVAGFQPSRQKEITKAFNRVYPAADVYAYSDLLAAARSLCNKQPGWAGILGTGANMCFYDGRQIDIKVRPLGYLLGDEGSGAFVGRQFIADYLRNKLPDALKKALETEMAVSYEDALEQTYNKPGPKKYWSGFMPFLHTHKEDSYVSRLIYESFVLHFQTFLPKKTDLPVHYTGSVAYYFADILRQAASDLNISLGKITESPIAGLALYHKNF